MPTGGSWDCAGRNSLLWWPGCMWGSIYCSRRFSVSSRRVSPAAPASIVFFDCFFFSVQTLATVGYGHMYPQTLYGHVVTTVEIMSGIFLFAVITGLIFVGFSRPVAHIAFSNSIVIGPLNGHPTLMGRIGNQNQHTMVDTEFRIMFMRDELLLEGGDFRYFYPLKLQFDRVILFPAARD